MVAGSNFNRSQRRRIIQIPQATLTKLNETTDRLNELLEEVREFKAAGLDVGEMEEKLVKARRNGQAILTIGKKG